MTTEFARAALLERARLAIDDPAGEAEAVAPLALFDAYRAVRMEPVGSSAPRRRTGDDRDLLLRIGADLGRTSGRVVCPAHGGRKRNLAWRLTPDGRALLKCHSHQCAFEEIVRAVS